MNKKCIQCGKCCKIFPCGIAQAFFGDYRPCPALECYNEKYYCGLILHPAKYFKLGLFGRKSKKKFIINFVKEYNKVGHGCNEGVGVEIHKEVAKSLNKKIKKGDRT